MLRRPVRDVVNKNNAEPQEAQRRCIMECSILDTQCELEDLRLEN